MPDPLQTDLGQRGYTRWLDRGSTLGRQRGAQPWYAPTEVELRSRAGGVLLWDRRRGEPTAKTVQLFGSDLGVKEVVDDGELFDRFLRLGRPEGDSGELFGSTHPEAVLAFARRYGAFLICQRHGQPAIGCPHSGRRGEPCRPGFPTVAQFSELSAQVRLILRIAVRIAANEEVDWEDWQRLVEVLYDLDSLSKDSDLRLSIVESWRTQSERPVHFVPVFVNRWLEFGEVGLRLSFERSGTWEVETTSASLLGAISSNLMVLVTGERGLAVCSGCGGFYAPPRRRPKKGQRRYCTDCGTGDNYRASKRINARERYNSQP